MRIGVFGGTFNPPHIGHLILASDARDQFKLETIFWVVTPNPPHKTNQVIINAKFRSDMVQATIKDYPEFIYSDVEFRRPGPHFSLDTVKVFHREFPGSEIYYLLGGDSLNDLPAWHDPVGFVQECDGIVVMDRFGEVTNWDDLEKSLPALRSKTHFLKTPMFDISSNDIRTRILQDKPWKPFVIRETELIINKYKLYR